MQDTIRAILKSRAADVGARLLISAPFWLSGFGKLLDWNGSLAAMAHFQLTPPALYAATSIVVELSGSALIIWGPWRWLGAGALAIFTLLTIRIAHHFWNETGAARTQSRAMAIEHLAVIGGLLAIAMLPWVRGRQGAAAERSNFG